MASSGKAERKAQCGKCGTGLIVGRCYRCSPRRGRSEDWHGVLYGTDWLLLRAQKRALARIPGIFKDDSVEGLALAGILGLIDAVQDAAALETDAFSVFGEPQGT